MRWLALLAVASAAAPPLDLHLDLGAPPVSIPIAEDFASFSMETMHVLDITSAQSFPVLLQHQQRVVGRPFESPAAIGVPRQADKPMQKVITGVRIGFDVIEENTRRMDQFRQSRRISKRSSLAIALRAGLSHERSRHSTVLVSKSLQLLGQTLWVCIGKYMQTVNP